MNRPLRSAGFIVGWSVGRSMLISQVELRGDRNLRVM
jgi:hypothetical protein